MALLVLLVGALSLPLVHEGAHALAAVLVGGRELRLERRGLELSVAAELPEARAALACFYGAGPCASVLVGAGLLSVALPVTDGLALSLVALGGGHLLYGAANLLPVGERDGARLWRLRAR